MITHRKLLLANLALVLLLIFVISSSSGKKSSGKAEKVSGSASRTRRQADGDGTSEAPPGAGYSGDDKENEASGPPSPAPQGRSFSGIPGANLEFPVPGIQGRGIGSMLNTTGVSGDGKCDDFDSPTRPDPFPTSIKWAQFVKNMDKLVVDVKNATLTFTTTLADAKNDEKESIVPKSTIDEKIRSYREIPGVEVELSSVPLTSAQIQRLQQDSKEFVIETSEENIGEFITSIELDTEEDGWRFKREAPTLNREKDNKAGLMQTFIDIFKPVAALITPIDRKLLINRAWTRVDPAVALRTIPKVIELAKQNPTAMIDKARLKWIEVNAMAATLHHIFDRLTPVMEKFGLEDVGDTMDLEYPSWVTTAVLNETGIGYLGMTSTALTEYVHFSMDMFGDKNHLIQALEKILCRYYGYKDWDPAKDRLNRYCFGNNKPYDLIHDNWDVLIDAAKYLVLSDMKYAIAQLTYHVYKSVRFEIGDDTGVNQTKPIEIKEFFEAIMKNMTERVDKKIKFSPLATLPPDVVIVDGPFVFSCSPTPAENCTETRQNGQCPPGVYIKNHSVFHNQEQLQVPKNVLDSVTLADGTPLACIRLERIGVNDKGVEVACNYERGRCIDGNGTAIAEIVEIKVIPRLVDTDGVPIHRANTPEKFDTMAQWGLYNCSKCALAEDGIYPECNYHDLPVSNGTGGPTPPGGPGGPGGPGAGTPSGCEKLKCQDGDKSRDCGDDGYVDCRTPGYDDSNSFELEGAIQGYLESELVLQHESKCIGTCQEYKRPTPTCTNKTSCGLLRRSHCDSPDSDCMANSNCPNNAKRCIKTSRQVTFCPALNGTGKIYEWVNISGVVTRAIGLHDSKNSTFDPVNPHCEGKIQRANERWAMEQGIILNTPEYCEICYCICMDPMSADAFYNFDVAALKTDIANGFVVTGLRFEKRNKTIALNIQQGKLLPGRIIDKSTLVWLDPSAHTPDLRPFGSTPEKWKKINLDIVEPSNENDVVTGIEWKLENNTLNLQVGFSSFDKVLATGDPKFRGALYPPPAIKRKSMPLDETVSPVKQIGPSQPYPLTHNDHYIEFDATSLSKDGAAAVVPFFDSLPLHSHEGEFRPLRNVEILYKSKDGYGGFLSVAAKFV